MHNFGIFSAPLILIQLHKRHDSVLAKRLEFLSRPTIKLLCEVRDLGGLGSSRIHVYKISYDITTYPIEFCAKVRIFLLRLPSFHPRF